MIRRAEEKDLMQLVQCAKEYVTESGFFNGLHFDEDKALTSIAVRSLSEDCVACVAVDGDVVLGVVSANIDASWTREAIAFEEIFYIRPEHRNARVAIKLCDFFIKECKMQGAKKIFSSSTAGFDDNGKNANAFTKLLKRFGFKEIKGGCVLIKDLAHEQV